MAGRWWPSASATRSIRIRDAASALLAARANGEPLPEEMIVGTIRQVLVVGIIAPTVVIGSIAVHLSRHPELQTQLRANPQSSEAATDEFLRLYTPYRGFARTARTDVDCHGRAIPAGEPIALVYASANRDEDVFDGRGDVPPRPAEHEGLGRVRPRPAHVRRLRARAPRDARRARGAAATHAARLQLDGPIVPTRFPEIGALRVPLRFG